MSFRSPQVSQHINHCYNNVWTLWYWKRSEGEEVRNRPHVYNKSKFLYFKMWLWLIRLHFLFDWQHEFIDNIWFCFMLMTKQKHVCTACTVTYKWRQPHILIRWTLVWIQTKTQFSCLSGTWLTHFSRRVSRLWSLTGFSHRDSCERS